MVIKYRHFQWIFYHYVEKWKKKISLILGLFVSIINRHENYDHREQQFCLHWNSEYNYLSLFLNSYNNETLKSLYAYGPLLFFFISQCGLKIFFRITLSPLDRYFLKKNLPPPSSPKTKNAYAKFHKNCWSVWRTVKQTFIFMYKIYVTRGQMPWKSSSRHTYSRHRS